MIRKSVRSRLAAGGRWIRTIGTPPSFLAAPSIFAQFPFRNINRLARDRDRRFESISLQERVHCEPGGRRDLRHKTTEPRCVKRFRGLTAGGNAAFGGHGTVAARFRRLD